MEVLGDFRLKVVFFEIGFELELEVGSIESWRSLLLAEMLVASIMPWLETVYGKLHKK